MTLTLNATVTEALDALAGTGTRRLALVRGEARLQAFPKDFQPLADAVSSLADEEGHEGAYLEAAPDHRALFGAFIHRTVRGQGAGGVRHWHYDGLAGYIQDGLRLARGMGHKSALAGLWWGGGKGVIGRAPGATPLDGEGRAALYRDYGRFVSSLRGLYIAAEDVGTTPADMAEVFRTTRHTTCVPPAVGGSGNPSEATAKGVVAALVTALDQMGLGSLEGKVAVMQGAGNVSGFMIPRLLERGVGRLLVTDVSQERLDVVARTAGDLRVTTRHVAPDDVTVFSESCDVFLPNALGAILNPTTIPLLACRVVCGAANNQLQDPKRDGAALASRGIAYVPDFVANRMGIVHCADEAAGIIPGDPAVARHFDASWDGSIDRVVRSVLARAEDRGTTPGEAAVALAEEASAVPHPLWGHRGAAIRDALIAERWYSQ